MLLFQAVNHHPAVDEAAEDLVEAIKDLTEQLEETASDTGAVTALVDSINKARSAVSIIFGTVTVLKICQPFLFLSHFRL